MKKNIILLFSFLIIQFAGFNQQLSELKGLDNAHIAEFYINYLKDGVLLVRLQKKQRKIDILTRTGNLADAENVRQEQLKTNKSIVAAFNDKFTFCPTYFFYSDDSKYVANNQLDSVTFLDVMLMPKLVKFDSNVNFLTAEFGIIKEDTALNYAGNRLDGDYRYYKDSSNRTYKNDYYNGGTNMSFGALLIKSNIFIQLSPPFPFYARTLATLPILRRSHNKVVEIMNSKLIAYYERLYGME
ncbi:hypothetical protein DNU06_15205 [Putridiphycobacter roseus]|uniref:Uncharacterized protein n=1 Tax=Putridiphycobacter roseus TaxID=2219161 RepID=A0A2W1NAE0_9FLAO|nr:hypothetical protein [Putridiphycobacter roseus]PZE15993.1 hypothetical protein DNU06_15205 [Putridiphycobacter roseus]